ncbi:MAG: hypothetical protein GY754_25725 [bacterium]|nr:hypothetical protein [bacterium]
MFLCLQPDFKELEKLEEAKRRRRFLKEKKPMELDYDDADFDEEELVTDSEKKESVTIVYESLEALNNNSVCHEIPVRIINDYYIEVIVYGARGFPQRIHWGGGRIWFNFVDEEYTEKAQEWVNKNLPDIKIPYYEYGHDLSKLLDKISGSIGLPPERKMLFFYERDPEQGRIEPTIPVVVTYNNAFSGEGYVRAWADTDDNGDPVVYYSIRQKWKEAYAAFASKKNVGKRYIIQANHRARKIQTISKEMTGENDKGFFTNFDSIGDARAAARMLNSRDVPVMVKIEETRKASPNAIQELLDNSINAIILILFILTIIMIITYKLPGIISLLILINKFLFMVLCLSLVNFELNWTGFCGIIISIILFIQSDILPYERTKQYFRSGVSLPDSLAQGFGNSFKTALHMNLVYFLLGAVVLFFGFYPIDGFGYSLLIGALVNILFFQWTTRSFNEAFILLKLIRKY